MEAFVVLFLPFLLHVLVDQSFVTRFIPKPRCSSVSYQHMTRVVARGPTDQATVKQLTYIQVGVGTRQSLDDYSLGREG